MKVLEWSSQRLDVWLRCFAVALNTPFVLICSWIKTIVQRRVGLNSFTDVKDLLSVITNAWLQFLLPKEAYCKQLLGLGEMALINEISTLFDLKHVTVTNVQNK